MKLQLVKGSASKLLTIFIQDSSSATGAGLTGLVFNSAGLSAYYYREGAASAVAITLVTMTLGTWTSGGFVVVDGTNLPGVYSLALPDAALATGANSVVVMLKGGTNMAPVLLEIQLTDINVHDGVRAGLTALPNAAAGAASGLITAGGTGNVLPNNAITAAVIATDAIDDDAIAASALGPTAFATDAITSGAVASGVSDEIAAKILATPANLLVTDATGRVTVGTMGNDTITAAVIATGAIDADAIADNAIDAGAIAADAITAAKIADGAIDAPTFAAGAINAAAIATDAITAAKIAADAIGASELAADAVTEIQSGLATAAAVAAVDDFVDTEITAIINTLGAPAGASLAADIAAIEAQTDDIGAAGAGLTALPWNAAWDAEVQSEVADALAVYDPPTHAELTTAIDGLPTAAEVNAEVLDVLGTDSQTEISAIPAAATTVINMIRTIYAYTTNKVTETATTQTLRNRADSATIASHTVSDDGTTYTRSSGT